MFLPKYIVREQYQGPRGTGHGFYIPDMMSSSPIRFRTLGNHFFSYFWQILTKSAILRWILGGLKIKKSMSRKKRVGLIFNWVSSNMRFLVAFSYYRIRQISPNKVHTKVCWLPRTEKSSKEKQDCLKRWCQCVLRSRPDKYPKRPKVVGIPITTIFL